MNHVLKLSVSTMASMALVRPPSTAHTQTVLSILKHDFQFSLINFPFAAHKTYIQRTQSARSTNTHQTRSTYSEQFSLLEASTFNPFEDTPLKPLIETFNGQMPLKQILQYLWTDECYIIYKWKSLCGASHNGHCLVCH